MEYSFSDIRIEELDTMYVASSYVISCNPEDEVITYMTQWMDDNNIDPKSRQFGFDIPVSEEQRQEELRGYEYWIKIKEDTQLCEGMNLKKIDKMTYAILRITNPFSNPFEAIPAGWKQLAKWVDLKGYDPDCSAKYYKEKYWLEEKLQEEGITYMDLYFPLS